MLDRKNKNRLIRIAVSLLIFLPVFILDLCLSLNEFLVLALTLCSYLIVGYDVILKSLRNMKNLRFLDENFLMLVATVGAFAVREYLEAVAVMIFYQIGANRFRKRIRLTVFAFAWYNFSAINYIWCARAY